MLDANDAFIHDRDDRQTIKVGDLFAYRAGSGLDWNHPNRTGYRRIADVLETKTLFSKTIEGR